MFDISFLSCVCSYKVKLDEGAEIRPQIPLFNNRIYDTKFESQFYAISDSNKVIQLFYMISDSIKGIAIFKYLFCF